MDDAKHTDKPARPYDRPVLVSFRYRCECVGREVLTESVVLDLDAPEDTFVWTMKRMREDIIAEVRQHLEKQR